MKPFIASLIVAAGVAGATPTLAHAYASSLDNIFAVIPDGDLNGIQSSQTFTDITGTVAHVSLTLNISGGINGDYYAYLLHNSTRAVLLNRVGRSSTSNVGYPDAGFGLDASLNSFTFDDSASNDVHLYRTFGYQLNGSRQLTGQWQPDGRGLDPLSAGSLFDTAARSNPLNVFNGTDPSGLWTLYLADVSPVGEGTLVSWGLVISVPEPASAGLMLAGLLVSGAWVRLLKERRR
jgi:subtilisin-like proprotein convertase family protein